MENSYAVIAKGKDLDEHDYNIIVSEENEFKTYELFYSVGKQWNDHVRGTRILSMTDTGDDFTITSFLEKKHRMGYDVFTELFVLMSFIKNSEKNLMPDYDVVKFEKVLTI